MRTSQKIGEGCYVVPDFASMTVGDLGSSEEYLRLLTAGLIEQLK
jgi:hypothetical protein